MLVKSLDHVENKKFYSFLLVAQLNLVGFSRPSRKMTNTHAYNTKLPDFQQFSGLFSYLLRWGRGVTPHTI